jgi:hypothetical protein
MCAASDALTVLSGLGFSRTQASQDRLKPRIGKPRHGGRCAPGRRAVSGSVIDQPSGRDYQAGCLRAHHLVCLTKSRSSSVEVTTMSWFDKRSAQQKPPPVKNVTVHILDVRGPKRTEFWQIDKMLLVNFMKDTKLLTAVFMS